MVWLPCCLAKLLFYSLIHIHAPFPNIASPVFIYGYDPPTLPAPLNPGHTDLPRLQASNLLGTLRHSQKVKTLTNRHPDCGLWTGHERSNSVPART